MARIAESRSCKFCGETGLMWKRVTNKYGRESVRLVSPVTGEIHVCPQYRKEVNNPPVQWNKTPAIDVANAIAGIFGKKEELPELPKIETEQASPELVTIEPIKEEKPIVPEWDGKHKEFHRLLSRVALKMNVLLVGPAGSGKTHSAMLVAESLNLPFYPMSVGPQTSKSDLIGYMSATGTYVRTVLREAYEHGGVFLLDEIDAGNAGVLTVLNALLANEVCSFPDGVIKKHENFRCIAAANTFGQGANRQYAGRQKLDDATLDRFVGIEWDYDLRLETKLAGNQLEWCGYVWALRTAAKQLGIMRVFGTRRIQQGAAMLNENVPLTEVKTETVFFGVSEDERLKLERHISMHTMAR